MAAHEWLIGWLATLVGALYAFRAHLLDRKDSRQVIVWEEVTNGMEKIREQHAAIQRNMNDWLPMLSAHAEALLEQNKHLRRLQDQVSSITLGRK